jgi:exodeoxyribonuclease-5
MTVKLTSGQIQASEIIYDWYNSSKQNQIFKLGGLAGTGKTFLVKHIIKSLGLSIEKGEVVFCAYTGKASLVLTRKGTPAETIHRTIYRPVDDLLEEKGEIKKAAIFEKKESLPEIVKLIVVDESSMVNKEILEDLLSFGILILFIGDYGQLPPVFGKFNLMEESGLDFKLTEIVRQAAENPIIKLSMMIRDGSRIPFGSFGKSAVILHEDELTSKSFLAADQILCGKNKTRHELNDDYRHLKGYNSQYPEVGERITLLNNNWDLGVVNGQDVILLEDFNQENRFDKLTFRAKCVDDYLYERYQEALRKHKPRDPKKINFTPLDETDPSFYEMTIPFSARGFDFSIEEEETRHEFRQRIKCDFAYAKTVHKSQGSEWEKILFFEERLGDDEFHTKFCYTAVTRSSDKLIWVRPF